MLLVYTCFHDNTHSRRKSRPSYVSFLVIFLIVPRPFVKSYQGTWRKMSPTDDFTSRISEAPGSTPSMPIAIYVRPNVIKSRRRLGRVVLTMKHPFRRDIGNLSKRQRMARRQKAARERQKQ